MILPSKVEDEMDSFDEALWNALEGMQIAPDGAALTFEARLAREQGWSNAFTERVMREYRRFVYMAATDPVPVTPSEAVDAAWHLHLTYSRHYWDVLCGAILKAPLHHDPTEGGAEQRTHFFGQYADTLARYEATFGAAPPADIWPAPAVRFAPPRRWKWGQIAAAAGASMLVAACTTLAAAKPAEEGDDGLILMVGVFVFVFVALAAAIFGARWQRQKGEGESGCSGGIFGGGDGDSGCGGGGCGGGCGG
jgi:hypothetical protein